MNYAVYMTLLAQAIIPPDKRAGSLEDLMTSFLNPTMQRTNDILNLYIDGFKSTIPYYDNSTSYAIGDLVIGPFDHYQQIYESQSNGNSGNSIDNINFWVNVSPNPIGVEERSKMYCGRMVFEYALNTWFGTTFRQPNFAGTSLSDIYITTNGYQSPLLYISPVDFNAGHFGPNGSTGFISPDDTPGFYATNQYTVHVPSAFYATLPGYTGAGTADNFIRKQVDKYGCFGLDYNIVQYT